MSAALRALPPWLAFLPREGAEVCPCSGQIVPQPAPRAEVR